MNFEYLKKHAVSGETILVDKRGDERLFLGFNRSGDLVTDSRDGAGALLQFESEIKNWKIKQDGKDLFYIWNVKDGDGEWFIAQYRMNKYGIKTSGKKSCYEHNERTICTAFKPIDKEGNEIHE